MSFQAAWEGAAVCYVWHGSGQTTGAHGRCPLSGCGEGLEASVPAAQACLSASERASERERTEGMTLPVAPRPTMCPVLKFLSTTVSVARKTEKISAGGGPPSADLIAT